MKLIDDYSFKILEKLGVCKELIFKDFTTCVRNKKTRSNRLKYLLERKLIDQRKGIYSLTEIGKEVLHDLKNIERNLSGSNCYENFDFVPYYFRDFIQDFLNILKHHLKKNLRSVILFGSVARGKWTSESDIDIFLIISDKVKNKMRLNQELTDLILDFYEYHILRNIMGEKQFHSIQLILAFVDDLNNFRTLYYDIAMDGIILLDKKNLGKEFIEKIKLRMRTKGLKRIYICDEDFYWKRDRIEFGELIEL